MATLFIAAWDDAKEVALGDRHAGLVAEQDRMRRRLPALGHRRL